jgi:sugar phosphate permease
MSTSSLNTPAGELEHDTLTGRSLYRKLTLRIAPFLCLCFFAAFLDRVNVGIAKLQMLDSLGFSETVYGLGAGLFFVGYILFEVPSNLILEKVGARFWIARIMVTWGILSGLTMFVKTPGQFYAARFLLGLAEAGFLPGALLYLTYWFPDARRGRIVALFMVHRCRDGFFLSSMACRACRAGNGCSPWRRFRRWCSACSSTRSFQGGTTKRTFSLLLSLRC